MESYHFYKTGNIGHAVPWVFCVWNNSILFSLDVVGAFTHQLFLNTIMNNVYEIELYDFKLPIF